MVVDNAKSQLTAVLNKFPDVEKSKLYSVESTDYNFSALFQNANTVAPAENQIKLKNVEVYLE